MRVLFVARSKKGKYAPFITEQVEALKNAGVEYAFFGVDRNGLAGYLRHVPKLKETIRVFIPDVIHAHYGLCGLLANLQRRIPVVTTYHGSDINNPNILKLSKLAIFLSAYNVFVSQKNIEIAKPKGQNYALIPCGICLDDYPKVDKLEARRLMSLKPGRKYILFSGAFDNRVKNASLAKEAIERIPDAQLIELRGYTRPQVAALMQAVDAILMTSFTEGSPQVIKEAMACGCPIVSVDVGDVKEMITGVEGCFIAERDPVSISDSLRKAIDFGRRTTGRDVILKKELTNDRIASKLIDIYNSLCGNNNT